MRAFLNPHVRRDDSFRGLFADEEYRDVHGYFAAHPELPPTPLRRLRSIAGALGLDVLYAKDETQRFGVNAFKIAGVRYAVHRLGDEIAARGLVCATAGNHGRAVAKVAHRKRIPCTVFVPSAKTVDPVELATRAARVGAMREDGATVIDVPGSYEDALRQAAAFGADRGATLISDTSLLPVAQPFRAAQAKPFRAAQAEAEAAPTETEAALTATAALTSEQIPHWIMAGYTQVLEEAFSQWDAPPTLVIVQGGVGGLVCAAASWFAWRFGKDRPFFIAAEPDNAACLLASAEAGAPVTIDSSLDTIMAGLRCAEPSAVAWPAVAAGVDAFVTVPDSSTVEAMKLLGAAPPGERVEAGPSGACGLAALVELARAPELENIRFAAGLDRSSRALVVITEGP